jgi:hypothetical protein
MLDTRRNQDARIRDEWLPDAEVWQFIQECLVKKFGYNHVEVSRMDERWIPLGIVGTLMWLEVTGWWVMENSGIRMTGEQFDQLYTYDCSSTLEPHHLLVFRLLEEERERLLSKRMVGDSLNDSLKGEEKGELLGFLRRRCFQNSGVGEPPLELLASIAWGALIWALTDGGQDWVAGLDEAFACTRAEGAAWKDLENEDQLGGVVLEPDLVEETMDGLGDCMRCGASLWCVKQHCYDGGMTFLCYSCMLVEKADGRILLDDMTWDEYANTMCDFDDKKPNLDCAALKCPHIIPDAPKKLEKWTGEKLRARGTQRMLALEEKAEQLGGIFGRSPKELVEHFTGGPKQ